VEIYYIDTADDCDQQHGRANARIAEKTGTDQAAGMFNVISSLCFRNIPDDRGPDPQIENPVVASDLKN
jgi:hypothetical protein